MASSQTFPRTHTRQKAQALRMLLTSGVIRSAAMDPPCIAISQTCATSPSISFQKKSRPARDYAHRIDLLEQWHEAFIDILKEFSRR